MLIKEYYFKALEVLEGEGYFFLDFLGLRG
jgi:hypothetical protein